MPAFVITTSFNEEQGSYVCGVYPTLDAANAALAPMLAGGPGRGEGPDIINLDEWDGPNRTGHGTWERADIQPANDDPAWIAARKLWADRQKAYEQAAGPIRHGKGTDADRQAAQDAWDAKQAAVDAVNALYRHEFRPYDHAAPVTYGGN